MERSSSMSWLIEPHLKLVGMNWSTLLKAISPVLPGRDVAAATRFYVDRPGFTMAFGDPGQADGYVGLRRDRIEVHLQFQLEQDFQAGTAGQACLRFEAEDLDALFEEWRDRGAYGAHTILKDTPWGTRVSSFSDPNGNPLTFQRDL
jgi:catechol 2,3-dioxygenase-like lactoylglutathione lyase family enzyme